MLDRSAAQPASAVDTAGEIPGRPGALGRAAAGAWHVLGGFGFLLRNPSLWGLAALPALLGLVLMAGGGLAIYVLFPSFESRVLPAWERIPDVLRFLMMLVLWGGTVVAGMVAGLAVALLLTSPFLDRLSLQVEAKVRGGAPAPAPAWDVLRSLRGGAYLLAAAPGAFLLSLIPGAGPLAASAWAGYALAFQTTDAPLTRLGLDFGRKHTWHRRWRAESLGFGLGGVVALVIPVANFILAPALATGATLFVLELEAVSPAATAPRPESAEPVAAGEAR